ncbi:MAG: TIM barrel protein [Flectobacillus sp.]|nr:TIM barrel protein [Flectobacillus sp.]
MTTKIPKTGVSLYSYAGEFGVSMTLEDCFAEMNDLGTQGLEILANAHIQNYPNPTEEWLEEWQRLLKVYDIIPVEYGHWVDSRMIPGRELTTQESYERLIKDIKLAGKLGFTVLRTKLGVVDFDLNPVPNWREFIEMALPLAEEHGVVMCPEIHQPTELNSKMVSDYVEFIEKTGTKHFGLNIDFGIFQTAERMVVPGFDNPPSTPEEIIPFLPYTYACHAKFIHMTEDFIEPTHPYEAIIKVLKDNNWGGYMLSEYEGKNKDLAGYATDQVRKHHVMMNNFLSK